MPRVDRPLVLGDRSRIHPDHVEIERGAAEEFRAEIDGSSTPRPPPAPSTSTEMGVSHTSQPDNLAEITSMKPLVRHGTSAYKPAL